MKQRAVEQSAQNIAYFYHTCYIGKLMKSSKAAIISSFLLFSVMNGTIGDLTLRGNMFLPVFLFGVSLICGFITMHNVKKEDVM